MMHTKISVITPSYNQGDYLEETILSVLDQQYPNLEYIIIDGGSTDKSVEIIRKYEKHLRYWVSEKDSGQSEAINKGLKIASGEIISWLCSDDLYLPLALTLVEEEFRKNPDAALIHGRTLLFRDKSKVVFEKGAPEEDLGLKYFATVPFPQPSSFFRRLVLQEQGLLDERLHFAMDYDLFIRTALHYPIVSVPHVLTKYRLHEFSKSVRNIPLFLEEWAIVFSKFIRSFPEHESNKKVVTECGLYHDGNDKYEHARKFSQEDMKKILLYFLENQMHGSYTVLNKKHVRAALNALRNYYPDYYNHSDCRKIDFRIRFFPVPVLRALRTILKRGMMA